MSGMARGVRSIRQVAAVTARSLVLAAAATAPVGWERVAPVEGGSATATAEVVVWHAIPAMHTARYGAGAEWFRQSILVIGGFDAHGDALRSVETYDLDYNRWTAAPLMPTARG